MTAATFLAVLAGALSGPLVPGTQVEHAYAGIACRVANSPACDRIGLAVALRPRPRRAVAYVGTRRLPLAPLGSGGDLFGGYLRHVGLERLLYAGRIGRHQSYWIEGNGPLIHARVVATFADGRRDVIPVLTPLRPGWG